MQFRALKKEDEFAVIELFKQLTNKEVLFNIGDIISDEYCNCVVIEDSGKIIGFGSLVIYQTPLKSSIATIEDVVVDKSYRGQGLGKKLMQELIKLGQDKKVKMINLTSKPSRVAARKLYESLGFKLLETGVFRLSNK